MNFTQQILILIFLVCTMTALFSMEVGVEDILTEYKIDSQHLALWRAVTDLNAQEAKALIAKGANVNTKMEHGTTILHEETLRECYSSTKLLLSLGADVEAKDDFGWTPIQRATELGGNRLLVEVLILNSPFNPLRIHPEVSREFIQAVLHVCEFYRLPLDVRKIILSHFPEHVLNQKHFKSLYNYGASVTTLVEVCPFAWFRALYEETEDADKAEFLRKVVPALTNYRLAKLNALSKVQILKKFASPKHRHPQAISWPSIECRPGCREKIHESKKTNSSGSMSKI